jgi:signal transduction histidine kinase/DNA-binding response OmpR family regulator
MMKQNIFRAFKLFAVLTLLISFIASFFHFSNQIHKKNVLPITDLSNALTYRFENEKEWKPFFIKEYLRTNKDQKKIFMQIQLPKLQEGQNAIYIEVIDMGANFYFKGKKFYSHGEWNSDGNVKGFPNFFTHLILLPPESDSQIIDAEIYADWKTIGIYGEVLLGNEKELRERLFLREFPNFTFFLFYLVISIFSLMIYGLTRNKMLLYFSLTVFFLSIICLMEADVNLTSVQWNEFSAFIGLASYFGMVFFFSKFIGELFSDLLRKIMEYYTYLVIVTYIYANYIIYNYGFTRTYGEKVEILVGSVAGIGAFLVISMTIKRFIQNDRNAKILALGLIAFFSTFSQYLFFHFGLSNKMSSDVYLRFFPIVISVMWIIALEFKDNINNLKESTALLEQAQAGLEERVREKTADLEIANSLLLKADLAKSEFFANISHEFKTPLTLILAPLENLAQMNPKDDVRFLYSIIHRNAIRMQSLVDDLLAIAKIDFGVFPRQRMDIDIKSYFKKTTEDFRILCDEKNLQFHLRESAINRIASIDRHKWDLVIRNLLSNAIKFTNVGSIELSYTVSDEKIDIRITDTGIGIAKDEIDLVFEKFYQSDRNKDVSVLGTGIGLFLVKEMVRDCEGNIRIESQVNVGTKVHLILPLYSQVGQKQIPEKQTKLSNFLEMPIKKNEGLESKYKILVVEDEPSMASFLNVLLRDKFEVTIAKHTEEAIKNIEMHDYDLILSDWNLPGKNGSYLFHFVKETKGDIPFLFLTAHTQTSLMESAFEMGAVDFIHKPFLPENLISRIQHQIAINLKNRQALLLEKDSIYGDIHDIIGGKLTDLLLQINQVSLAPEISKSRLNEIKNSAVSLSNELRNKLHDWEDMRNLESDFELGWMSMLVRRYSAAGRQCRVKLSESQSWPMAERWKTWVKTEIFRITQEIVSNDLKYGLGNALWEIDQFSPNFHLSLKTKTNYPPDAVKGRGSRNLSERSERLSAKLTFREEGGDFYMHFSVPDIAEKN